MPEHDPNQSRNAESTNESGGAAFGAASAGTSEFLRRGAEAAKPIADLGTRNLEACVVSAKVAGRVVESVTREVTEYGRKAADDAFALARSFADVRSPDDLLRVQSQFAKAAFDNAMFFSKNVTEALKETADEVVVQAKASSSTDPSGQ
jgi:hypothetical protein